MMRLLNLFKKPWFIALVGVLLLSLLIWFVGPLVAIAGHEPFASETVRWVVIVLIFLVWAVYLGVRFALAVRENNRMLKALAAEQKTDTVGDAGAAQSKEEVEHLRKRFEEALALLKKAKLGGRGGSQFAYQLPWYVFVGAPGSGKTTALVNSGLRFPLAEQFGRNAVRGIGGTRDCDWWFTDEAVLLDTAGRYTTQDSHREVDQAAWSGFLALLRQYRKRRPLNGAIVTVSVSDLLRQNEAERTAHAQVIRSRLHELYERLQVTFPLYVMISKCDLLAGFTEFFDRMGEEQRAQVWGITFPSAVDIDGADEALKSFPKEFDALEARLNAQLMEQLQQERDPRRRALIYGFPQQVAALRTLLERFLTDVFQSSRYQDRLWLRGVYFTSGTQEGSPIDRILGSLAGRLGVARQALPFGANTGKSFFLTRLLSDVIFAEAGLAGINRVAERRRTWIQRGAYALAAVIAVSATVGYTVSYLRNRSYVAEVERQMEPIRKQVAELTPERALVVDPLPLLGAVRNLPWGYEERDKSVPWLMGLGLFQGDKLGTGAQELYVKLLNDALLPRMKRRLEGQLREGFGNNAEWLYEGLRVYLMLGDRAHCDVDTVREWFALDNKRNVDAALGPEYAAQLAAHEAALLEKGHLRFNQPLDAQLVADVRRKLAELPLAQRLYARLAREISRAGLPEFSVAGVGGSIATTVLVRRSAEPLTRGLSGLYTVAGYQKFLERARNALGDLARDNWVLDQREAVTGAAAAEMLRKSLMQVYYDDYIKQWDGLLADVTVVPIQQPSQGARVLAVLSGPDSPLKKFLLGAAKETTLAAGAAAAAGPGGDAVGAASAAAAAAKSKLDDIRKRLESALGSADAPDAAPVATPPDNPVDVHFDYLHKMVAGTPSGLDALLAQFNDVAAFLDATDAAKRTGAPPPNDAPVAKLKRDAEAKGGSVGPMIAAMADGLVKTTAGNERDRLSELWASSVGQFCQRAVAGRYPMVRSAAQEITPDDFTRFFGPAGLVDDFFSKNLQQHVDMSGPRWRWRATGQNSLGISADVLADLQRAATIRDAFFHGQARGPSIRFELRPVTLDDGLAQFTFEVDGQTLTFSPASAKPGVFNWPGNGAGSAHIDIAPPPARGLAAFSASGYWALFRLLDRATVERTGQAERLRLGYDLEGKHVVLDLVASSVINPFQRDALEQFRCRPRL